MGGGHHGHGHGHGHDHDVPADPDRAFRLGVALNVGFVVVEAVYGVLADSIALLADAAHNLSDVLGLLLAWWAVRLARRAPTPRFTYGLGKTTILAALANAILILVAVGGVAWEAVGRLLEPPPVQAVTVMVVAAIGVVINTISAFLFFADRHDDVNRRAAFVHLATDAAVSLGVVVGGAVVWKTGFDWIDPGLSLVIAVVIVVGTWSVLREAFELATDAVPARVDPAAIERVLTAPEAVHAVHDLHVWAMSTTRVALTAHLEMRLDAWTPALADELVHALEAVGVHHVTLQPEPPDDRCHGCAAVPKADRKT